MRESTYFCVFEAEFRDGAALGAAMGSPEGRRLLPMFQTLLEIRRR
jgi:hypothetical protein